MEPAYPAQLVHKQAAPQHHEHREDLGSIQPDLHGGLAECKAAPRWVRGGGDAGWPKAVVVLVRDATISHSKEHIYIEQGKLRISAHIMSLGACDCRMRAQAVLFFCM